LGIDPSASPDEIRRAYHHKAKSLHPDTRENSSDDQAFIQLTDGYRVLKDPVLKTHYDQSRHHIGEWREGSIYYGEHSGKAGRKSRKTRYALQLSGVILFMAFAVFIFNLIYESQVLNDGFYTPPQPERAISDSSAKMIVDEVPAAALVADPNKGGALALGLDGRVANSLPIEIGKKNNRVLTGIPDIDRKILVQPSHPVSGNGTTHPVVDKKLETKGEKKGRSSSIQVDNDEPIESTEGSATVRQQRATPPIPAITFVKTEKMTVENRTGGDSVLNPKRADSRAGNNEMDNATTLLRKFAEEDREIKRVAAFIRRYSETYEKRDYPEFTMLFTEDATENGQAFSELAAEYRQLFAAVEKFEYKIKLHRTSLLVDREMIRTVGVYTLAWQAGDGVRRESEGPISFEIVKRNEEYQVQKLKYGKIEP
jgi:hypothetical protein